MHAIRYMVICEIYFFGLLVASTCSQHSGSNRPRKPKPKAKGKKKSKNKKKKTKGKEETPEEDDKNKKEPTVEQRKKKAYILYMHVSSQLAVNRMIMIEFFQPHDV